MYRIRSLVVFSVSLAWFSAVIRVSPRVGGPPTSTRPRPKRRSPTPTRRSAPIRTTPSRTLRDGKRHRAQTAGVGQRETLRAV